MLRLRLLGIELQFSFWFFALLALFLLAGSGVLVYYLALPVLLHELGHLLAMLLLRVPVRSIAFTPVSVQIRRHDAVLSFSREMLITLAGPLANLLAALLLYHFWFQSVRVMFLLAANLAVALFNLLPIGNLDGGTACALLCERYLHPQAAWRISLGVSFLVLTPLFALGILLLLRGSGNVTLLLTCGYLLAVVIRRE